MIKFPTVVSALALAAVVQSCPSGSGCSREEAPEFFTTTEEITRVDVVAVLGEPIETIKSEDGRIDVKSDDPERDPATGKWTKLDYFHIQSDGQFQLYDLKSDPTEENNLANKYTDKVQALHKLLNHYRTAGRSAP